MKESILYNGFEHKNFFLRMLAKCRSVDEYHMALIYCLGICRDTREHIDSIYDFETGCVKPECLHEGWQTSGSARVTRLAFNLYCNGMPSVINEDKIDDVRVECGRYAPDEIFSCGFAPYFWQGIQLRYPEYCAEGDAV